MGDIARNRSLREKVIDYIGFGDAALNDIEEAIKVLYLANSQAIGQEGVSVFGGDQCLINILP